MSLKRLHYWWFRHRNSHPCKAEMYEVMQRTTLKNLRVTGIGTAYATDPDATLESLAVEMNVTRERIRQILWKLHRSVE